MFPRSRPAFRPTVFWCAPVTGPWSLGDPRQMPLCVTPYTHGPLDGGPPPRCLPTTSFLGEGRGPDGPTISRTGHGCPVRPYEVPRRRRRRRRHHMKTLEHQQSSWKKLLRKQKSQWKKMLRKARAQGKKLWKRAQAAYEQQQAVHRLWLAEFILAHQRKRNAQICAMVSDQLLLTANLATVVDQARAALKLPKRRPSSLSGRKYDSAKHLCLDQIRALERHNVPFDAAAEAEKQAIWGPQYRTTCAWTLERGHETKPGSGLYTKGLSLDHLFPIRGAYGNAKNPKTGWLAGGLRGSDSEWNTIYVFKQHNTGYKVFDHTKTHQWKKDIAWQTLTPTEYGQCTAQERRFYDKLVRWRAYVNARGAHYTWQYTRESNEANEDFLRINGAFQEAILPVVTLEKEPRGEEK